MTLPNPDFHIVIPARFDSKRFPGKPLALINGKPMIQHVYEVALCTEAKSITIATDSPRIVEACEDFEAQCLLTDQWCETGTDRVAQVCEKLGWERDTIVVNLQGDEPLMPPDLISQVAGTLAYYDGNDCEIATLFTYSEDIYNPNHVKVVTDEYGVAMYFSRCPIPHGAKKIKRHIGLYAYRVGFLLDFVKMVKCGLENTEQLEQLRAMYHGAKIRVDEAMVVPGPDVNAPEDVEEVIKGLKSA